MGLCYMHSFNDEHLIVSHSSWITVTVLLLNGSTGSIQSYIVKMALLCHSTLFMHFYMIQNVFQGRFCSHNKWSDIGAELAAPHSDWSQLKRAIQNCTSLRYSSGFCKSVVRLKVGYAMCAILVFTPHQALSTQFLI